MSKFLAFVAICIVSAATFDAGAQTLMSAQFRKAHAAAGDIDLPIDINQPVSGNVSVEPRAEAAGHRVVFQYDAPITSVAGATVVNSVGTAVGSATAAFAGNEVTVTVTGIADASLVSVTVNGVNGAVSNTVNVGFLIADFDATRSVNGTDVGAAKSRSGASASSLNGRYDIGMSGRISAVDIAIAKVRTGRALPTAGQVVLRAIFGGAGVGSVISSPGGVSCPSVACAAAFATSSMTPLNVQLTATPNTGSMFAGWSGDCSGGTAMTNILLTKNSDCVATFNLETRVVTPNMPANGTVSPPTAQTVNYNSTVVFTLAPNVGFVPAVTGTCGGMLSGNTYTTNPVTANCSVNVSFNAQNINVTPSAGSNGTISPNTVQSVPFGTTRTFTVTPNTNYTAMVGGTCGGTLVGNTFTTNTITASCTVAATFVRLSYTVTPSAGPNGTISPSSAQSVLSGATRNFTVTPNAGYTAVMSGTCGGTLSGTTFTTSPITGNCSVVATFASTQPKYVSTTGNDTTGTGTSANPWRTIGRGITSLVGGETLIVRNGTYTGTANFIRNLPSGTPQLYTNVVAESPMQVRIQSASSLAVNENQLNLAGNYIKVDGFIFDMSGTINPAFVGVIGGNFNTLSRSIFKRGGDIDSSGGLLSVTGSDTLIEDVAGAGACRYCFAQGGAMAMTQRNVWRRVVGRFDYSNSTQTKATFATEGSAVPGNVRDHLYQNVIAIDGQNPGNLGGSEKMGGFYVSSNTSNVQFQGSIVLNEGAGPAGALLSEMGSNNPAGNMVVWDIQNSLPSATGIVAGSGDRLTVGGNVQGAATNLLTPATNSLLKPMVLPQNLLNNTPGAVITKRLGTSGTRWGQAGFDQPTTADLWPWPFQAEIAAVFREANPVPPGNSPATNDTNRGFTSTVGNALNGGQRNLTTYVWEYLGTPCPPTVCQSFTVTSSAGAGGTINPASTQNVLPNGQLTFTVTPNAGFTASVGGTCGGTLSGTTYTTNPVTANCTVSASFSATKYVATTGNDSTGDGSFANPWKTISKGINTMAGGDILVVRNGTYTGLQNFINNVKSGTASKYTVIMAETPMEVRIQSATGLGYYDYMLNLANNYIKVDGFIFDMAGTTYPPHIGNVEGNFNKIMRSIFKRSGDIDAYGGLLFIGGNDNLVEDVAGTGACRYCFEQGGPDAATQRTIWRRVVGRMDYSNSNQPKATFSTYGNNNDNSVRDHLYQNVIAIDGQRPSSFGGEEKYGGFYAPKRAENVRYFGSIVLNEGVGYFGMFLREFGAVNSAHHSVIWNLPGSLSFAGSIKVDNASNLTIGGIMPGGTTPDSVTPVTGSLIGPAVNPPNLLNNTPGAVILKRWGVSGTRWGEPGYDQLTNEDLWPWPYQDKIKSVFRETNNPPAGNSPSTNNTLRGFAANGNGLYGGPITLTSYIWEFLGTPCPASACP
ncbi:MAG: hypothetical protein JNK75_12240 [Betaproteobacteria bacterium]|nr:hypothetical protein [Betaproteobacteria bacterium]